MIQIGHYCLCLACALALYGFLAGFYACWADKRAWSLSVGRATVCSFVCAGAALLSLAYALCVDDFAVGYVFKHSSVQMLLVYKISALWAGMEGSLLLWAWLLTGCAFFLRCEARKMSGKAGAGVLAFANSSCFFFLAITVFWANPFGFLDGPYAPPDGAGLNPLLQNPLMAVHPPILFAGFAAQMAPCALCLGALFSRQEIEHWAERAQSWVLAGWAALTAGVALGALWAYVELGWGGYWAWDPVENASLLPWLAATALMHSLAIFRRRGTLLGWSACLSLLGYALTILATFITRSGAVQSVHAFGANRFSWVFVFYLALVLLVGTALLVGNKPRLQSAGSLSAPASSALFCLSNVILLATCAAIIWGVFLPLVSEVMPGGSRVAGSRYYNSVCVPLFLTLMVLMAVCTAAGRPGLGAKSAACVGVIAGICSGGVAALVLQTGLLAAAAFAASSFALVLLFYDFVSKVRASWPGCGREMTVIRFSRSLGLYCAHAGFIVLTIGAAANGVFKIEREVHLQAGQIWKEGQWEVTFGRIIEGHAAGFTFLRAELWARRTNSDARVKLEPELRFYGRSEQSTSEVGLHVEWLGDLYVSLAAFNPRDGRGVFKVYLNPLQVWIWIGAGLMFCGAIMALSARRSGAYD